MSKLLVMKAFAFLLFIILATLIRSHVNAQTADFYSNATDVCLNTIVRFTDSSTGAFSWEWNFGSGAFPASAAGVDPHDVIYSTGGFKTVTLTINGNITRQAVNYINVSPLSVGGVISGNSGSICPGESTGNMVLSGHTGNVEKWQKRHNGGGWTDIVNYTSNHSESLTSSGLYQFRTVVRSGQCASAVSSDVSVAVNVLPKTISTVKPAVCAGTGFFLNLQENIVNGISCTFSWTGDYPAGLVGGTHAGTGHINHTLMNNTSGLLEAVYTISPFSLSGNCTGAPFTITVPVYPKPVGINNIKLPVCSDVSFILNPQENVANKLACSFTWTGNYASGITGGLTGGTGVISQTLKNSTGNLLNAVYTVTPISMNGSCLGSDFTITLPVNSQPAGISTVEPEICSGTVLNLDPQINIINNMHCTFYWNSTFQQGLNGGIYEGEGDIEQTLTNLTGTLLNAVFTVTPVALGNSCSGSDFTITLPVNPEPSGVARPSKQSVCSGTAIREIEMINTSAFENVNYFWNRNNLINVTGLPSNGQGKITGRLFTASDASQEVKFYITPLSSAGCKGASFNASVMVNPVPVVDFTIKSTFNIAEEPYILTGIPSGGIFTGPGVVSHENKFYPSIAGLGGPFIITYNYADPKGCVATASHPVHVQKADREIVGVNSNGIHCYEEGDIGIRVHATGIPGVFAGKGITDFGNNTAVFNTVSAGSGSHQISYWYTDDTGTGFEISTNVYIDSIGVINFINLSQGDEFCKNDDPFEIVATPLGGTFSATSEMTNNLFSPGTAGTGINILRYTFTSQYGCSKSDSITVFINEVPSINFNIPDPCIDISDPDSIVFINTSDTQFDKIVKWRWNFGNNLATETDNNSELFEPKHLYPSAGLRNVRLTAETDKGCSETLIRQIDLGDKPRVDFKWDNECFSSGNAIHFTNTSQSNTHVSIYEWTFANEDDSSYLATLNTPDVAFVFPEISGYRVSLSLTNQLGCNNSLSKTIYLRQVIRLSEGDYFEDFEQGPSGWIPDKNNGTTISSWTLGSTAGSSFGEPLNGRNAWFTLLKNRSAAEQSWISSPCFDFREVKKPMLKLDLWRYFERNKDGGLVQFSVDNGLSWQNLGSINDGINWYNSFQIDGQPGGQQVGWTAPANGLPDTKWTDARHDLDHLAGEPDVRFRIAYGSNGTGTINQGFAFNNLRVSERSRLVLLENFTNTADEQSKSASELVTDFVATKPDIAALVNYHTSYSGTDPLNRHNPADPAARSLFYGISSTPYTIMDGGLNGKGRYDYSQLHLNELEFNLRSLTDPAFKIEVEQHLVEDHLTAKVNIISLANLSKKDMTLHLLVIEKEIEASLIGQPGNMVFKNVVKKLLPDAGGTHLPVSWNIGQTGVYSFSWNMNNVFDKDKIAVVVFIQDEKTREIYQVGVSSQYSLLTGITPGQLSGGPANVRVFPNPATDNIFIQFEEVLNTPGILEIYSITGTMISSEKIREGNSLYIYNTDYLREGVYVFRLLKNNTPILNGKVVITK